MSQPPGSATAVPLFHTPLPPIRHDKAVLRTPGLNLSGVSYVRQHLQALQRVNYALPVASTLTFAWLGHGAESQTSQLTLVLLTKQVAHCLEV